MQLQAASEITPYLLHRARHLLSVKSAVHYEVPPYKNLTMKAVWNLNWLLPTE